MALTEDWKRAKKFFEDATKKKKPTESFMGVFRKGTGVEGALKKADAAKTAADLRKALAEFQKEATTYTKTLKTAAADPKSVKPEEKAHYIGQVQKLEKALEELVATGEGMAAALEGTDKKAKVDPALMKQEAELAAHLALRKKMTPTLNGVFADYKKRADEIDNALKQAIAHTGEAKKKKGVEARVEIGTVQLFQKQAVDVMKATQADWDKRTEGGSEMMKARGDSKTTPDAWSQQKKADYAKESNAAFGSYNAIQVKIQGLLNDMGLKIAAINRTAEEADTYSGLAQDPKTFVARIDEINKEMTELDIWTTRKLGTLKNNYEKQKGVFDKKGDTKEAMLRGFTLVRDAEVKAKDLTESKTQSFVTMAKRMQIVPTDLRSDPLIAPGLKQFAQLGNKVKLDLLAVKKDQQGYIDYLNQCLTALSK